MRRLAAAIVWLTAVWVALWEDVTWANVLSGALIAFLITRRIRVVPSRVRHRVRPRAFLALVLYFVRELIKASLIVAWEVITPGTRINPAVVSVRLRTRSPFVATTVANLNSLTPGTLTLELDEETMTLFIHVLHLESIQASRRAIHHLEALVMAAFPVRGELQAEQAEGQEVA